MSDCAAGGSLARSMETTTSGCGEAAADVRQDAGEELLEGEDAAERDVDAAHRDRDDGADLEQTAADGADLGAGEFRARKREAAQVVEDGLFRVWSGSQNGTSVGAFPRPEVRV